MSFQVNNFSYARLRTYGDAKLFFERVKPIRGQDKDLQGVPLRDDRKYWQSYRLKKDHITGDYMVRMYNTNIAVFKPDGTTVIDASYGSMSTNALVENYTPRSKDGRSAYLYMRGGRPIIGFGKQWFWAGKPVIFKDGEIINKTDLAVEKRVLNRKRAKAVREKLQPFMEYVRTMRTLTEGTGMPSDAVPKWEGNGNPFDRDITDPNNFPGLLRRYWVNKWFFGGLRAIIRPSAEKEILEAAYARDEAYDWKPLEEGTTHKTMRYELTI